MACTWEGMEGREPGAWGGPSLAVRRRVGSLSGAQAQQVELCLHLAQKGWGGHALVSLQRLAFPAQGMKYVEGEVDGGQAGLWDTQTILNHPSLIEEDTGPEKKET